MRYHLLSPAVIAFRAIWPHQLCVQCVAFCLATNVFGRRAYFSRVFADPSCECQSGTSLTPPVVHSRHPCSGHPLPVASTRHGHQFRCQLVPHVLARPCFTLPSARCVFSEVCVCFSSRVCMHVEPRRIVSRHHLVHQSPRHRARPRPLLALSRVPKAELRSLLHSHTKEERSTPVPVTP